MKPFAFFLPLAFISSVAMAQKVKVEAIADRTAVKPGETMTVALLFTMQPGWHIYWTNPGETGTPPKAKWQTPAGVTVAEPRFPVPHRMDGAVTAFGYEQPTAILYDVAVPAGAKSTVELQSTVSWVVCSADACVSERLAVALSVPIGDGQPNRPADFASWRTALPEQSPSLKTLTATVKPDGKHGSIPLNLQAGETPVDFFPPKSDALEFGRPTQTDGNWAVDFRILSGAPNEFTGTGVLVIKNSALKNPTSAEVRVAYRLPKPSSKE